MAFSAAPRSSRLIGLLILLFGLVAIAYFNTSGASPKTPAPFSTHPWENHDALEHLPPPADQRPEHPQHSTDHRPSVDVELDIQSPCSDHPDNGKIAIAVKTGATEAVERIPMLMATALKCAGNVTIYSDLEEDIAGYHLHDAIADIPRSAMEGNSDFDFYWHLKEAQKLGEIEAMLKAAKDPRMPQDLAAWTLDKYKQLHILEKLYAGAPDKDWYMMIDADTYIVWPNLLIWLEKLEKFTNPRSHKLYLGSPAIVAGVQFAHGGSGILLSHAAMYEFAGTGKQLASKWDEPMHEECCGDLIIGTELKHSGIELQPSWPTVNGEKPITLPFGPTHWCQPVVTMHHVDSTEMNQLYGFQQSRKDSKTPMTFADLYHAFIGENLPDSLPDWDNISNDQHIEGLPYEGCERACEENKECFQFSHQGKLCHLGRSIHLGRPLDSSPGQERRSGWMKQRIKDWVKDQPPCDPVFPWTVPGWTDH